MMKTEEGDSAALDEFQAKLNRSKVNIRAITSLFREPQFESVITYFRNRIFLETKLPDYVMALEIRPSEKYVMMPMLRGFVYSLNHTEEEFVSWDIQVQTLVGDTSSVVRSIRENNIPYSEVLRQVSEIYEKLRETRPEVSKCSLYNNISYYYRNKLVRIFKEMLREIRPKKRQRELDGRLNSLPKLFSLEGVRQLL